MRSFLSRLLIYSFISELPERGRFDACNIKITPDARRRKARMRFWITLANWTKTTKVRSEKLRVRGVSGITSMFRFSQSQRGNWDCARRKISMSNETREHTRVSYCIFNERPSGTRSARWSRDTRRFHADVTIRTTLDAIFLFQQSYHLWNNDIIPLQLEERR